MHSGDIPCKNIDWWDKSTVTLPHILLHLYRYLAPVPGASWIYPNSLNTTFTSCGTPFSFFLGYSNPGYSLVKAFYSFHFFYDANRRPSPLLPIASDVPSLTVLRCVIVVGVRLLYCGHRSVVTRSVFLPLFLLVS